jgi:hypothetical protein
VSAIEATVNKIDSDFKEIKSHLEIITKLVNGQDNDALISEKYFFDPINITGDRNKYNTGVKFFDDGIQTINILDAATRTKVWRRSSHEKFPGDLFKEIMIEVSYYLL